MTLALGPGRRHRLSSLLTGDDSSAPGLPGRMHYLELTMPLTLQMATESLLISRPKRWPCLKQIYWGAPCTWGSRAVGIKERAVRETGGPSEKPLPGDCGWLGPSSPWLPCQVGSPKPSEEGQVNTGDLEEITAVLLFHAITAAAIHQALTCAKLEAACFMY